VSSAAGVIGVVSGSLVVVDVFGWVLMVCRRLVVVGLLVLVGCNIGPSFEVPLQNRCGYPVAVAAEVVFGDPLEVGSGDAGSLVGPSDPVEVDAEGLWDDVDARLGNFELVELEFSEAARDVDELLLRLTVDAGGSRGLVFVAGVPVVQHSEELYGFLEGAVLVEGDRCPPQPE